MSKLLLALFIHFYFVLPVYPLEGRCSNEAGKIGIRTDWERKIVKCYHGCPAYYAGLRIEDKILLVDGSLKKEITGPPYTEVTIVVRRGFQILTFKVSRIYESEIKILRKAAFMSELGETDVNERLVQF